jgi:hypothetical protein
MDNAFKGVGDYPQHQTMSKTKDGYDYNAPDSVYQLWTDRFLEIQPNFNSIVLSSKIKLTDKLSSGPIGWFVFLVSEKLLNILQRFNLPPYRIYPVPVLHGKKAVHGYSAMHILLPDEFVHEVVFEQSKFWVTKGLEDEKIEELHLNSVADLEKVTSQIDELNQQFKASAGSDLEARRSLKRLFVRAEYFSVRQEFLEKMDLFTIPGNKFAIFPRKFYASSELRHAIEAEKCTGVRFINRQDWEEGYMTIPGWPCLLKLPWLPD